MSLLQQLRPQGRLITGVVQDPGDGLTPVCRDDPGDLVADELVVGDAHDLDSTARLITAKWQRVAIPGRGPNPSGGLAAYRPLRPERGQLQVRARPGAAGASRAAADVRSATGTSGSFRGRPPDP